jgi:hypothetical protein
MPPNLDVYVISRARDRETIERFLSTYVDRAASEERGDEELMILALDSSGQPSGVDDWEWEPSKSLTHIVERGLQFPRRAFSVELNTRDVALAGATLAFDTDNQVIFGISVDDEGASPENLEQAKILLHEMAQAFAGSHGYIGVEDPPPLRGASHAPTILLYSWVAE